MNPVDEPTTVVRGDVAADMVAYAREKLVALALDAPGPVLDLQLRLDHHGDPARDCPNHVEVAINLDGRPIHARGTAATMTEAIDSALTRLRRRLESCAEQPQSVLLRHRDGRSWHHGDRPSERTRYFPRPPEEREIVRRKTFAMSSESIEGALFDLEALDHDFFLFVNDETGEENVVYRENGDYGLMQPTPTAAAVERVGIALRTGSRPHRMKLRDACDALDQTEVPFVFYIDVETGRGRIVYRRYDGHYGLVTPA